MTPALLIKNLQKTYPNQFQALKGIDLEVAPGDFFALLGPNGAGKSTTIGIISSLVTKTAGQVQIFGQDIDQDFSRAKKFIGVVPQEFNFNPFEKVLDIILQQAGYYGIRAKDALARAEMLLQKLGLWDKKSVQARMLSGGMKRRLMIARALIHKPQLLILDEPTAGVDIELRRSMWDFLKEINADGTTIILTTHYLEEAESLCRNVAIINHGEIVKNTSIKNLLQQLAKETFIFDVSQTLESAPPITGFEAQLLDAHSFEIQVEKGQTLNSIFAELTAQNIQVVSMRNKANRLEEMFVSMVSGHKESRGGL